MKLLLVLAIFIAIFAFALGQTTPKKDKNKDDEKPKPTQKGKPQEPQQSTTKTPESTTKKTEMTFSDFKENYNKTYTNKEAEKEAEKNFNAAKGKIDAHNSNPKKRYSQKINEMADLSPEEFRRTRLGGNKDTNTTSKSDTVSKRMKNVQSAQKNYGVTLNETVAKAMPQNYDLRR